MNKRHAVFQVTFLAGVPPGRKVVQAEEIILGRMEDCDLVIDHKDASRRHLSVKTMYGQVIVEDLGSSNGTYVNGVELKPKTPTVVSPSDTVGIGKHIQMTIQCDYTEVAPPPISAAVPQPAVKVAPPPPPQEDPKELSVPARPKEPIREAYREPARQPAKEPAREPVREPYREPIRQPVPEITKEMPKEAVRPDTVSAKLEIVVPKLDLDSPLPRAIRMNERLHQELVDARNEAKRLLAHAQKQATSIVQEAERLAEVKTQGFYDRARRTEAEAEELYKTRTEEAHRDATKEFEETRAQCQSLVHEAREKAQSVRDQAETFAAELRAETHKKMLELTRAGEAQMKELSLKRAKEAAEFLEKREEELEVEVFTRLKAECDEIKNQQVRKLELTEKEALDRVALTEAHNRELMQAQLDAKLRVEELRRDVDRHALELGQKRDEVARAVADLERNKYESKEVISLYEKSLAETSKLRAEIGSLQEARDRQLAENRRDLAAIEREQAELLAGKAVERERWFAAKEEELTQRLKT
ncbi:MAG: FHA domain-containing protein, partial [Bdellovibrionota bacterium]